MWIYLGMAGGWATLARCGAEIRAWAHERFAESGALALLSTWVHFGGQMPSNEKLHEKPATKNYTTNS